MDYNINQNHMKSGEEYLKNVPQTGYFIEVCIVETAALNSDYCDNLAFSTEASNKLSKTENFK